MPSSSAVTTEHIVRMMKRGENGSISVSMDSLGCFAGLFFVASSGLLDSRYTIPTSTGHGYDNWRCVIGPAIKLPNQARDDQSAPVAGAAPAFRTAT